MKDKFALASVIFGLIVGSYFLGQGQLATACIAILSGLYLGCAWFFGFIDSISSPSFKAAAGVIFLIGICDIFLSNQAFNNELQGAYTSAVTSFLSLNNECKQVPNNLVEDGLSACTAQSINNQASATSDFAKAIYFGPGLSLVDTTYTATQEKPKNNCAQAFKKAFEICPGAFRNISESGKAALINVLK